ncbi:hypothetical protein RNS80_13120, partial [Staphylococcus pseudintermedius]
MGASLGGWPVSSCQESSIEKEAGLSVSINLPLGVDLLRGSRLGQGLVYRCYQLSQILRGGFVNDTEQISPLFLFVAQIGEEGFQ